MAENPNLNQNHRGVRGNPVVYAVIASFLLMAVYLFATWPSPTSSINQQTGSSEDTSSRASSANSSRVPGGNPSYPQPAVPSANNTKP